MNNRILLRIAGIVLFVLATALIATAAAPELFPVVLKIPAIVAAVLSLVLAATAVFAFIKAKTCDS